MVFRDANEHQNIRRDQRYIYTSPCQFNTQALHLLSPSMEQHTPVVLPPLVMIFCNDWFRLSITGSGTKISHRQLEPAH